MYSMSSCTELVRHLQEAHGIELHSFTLLQAALESETEPTLRDVYERHIVETKGHVSWIETLLDARGAQPSLAADIRGRVTGDFASLAAVIRVGGSARTMATVYAYEHFEIATYELVVRVAERFSDGEASARCQQILNEEHATAAALHACFDQLADRTQWTSADSYESKRVPHRSQGR